MSKFLKQHASHSKTDEHILKTKLQDKFGKQSAHNNGYFKITQHKISKKTYLLLQQSTTFYQS